MALAKKDGIREIIVISSSSDEEEEEKEEEPPVRSILCLKKKVSLKEVEEVEDCFILEYDPFESIDFSNLVIKEENQHKDDDNDNNAQELSVIAERGQVACRDYPHSRHLCAKFPFDKTPHETYCQQCYCYVCDSLAPCKSWTEPVRGHCHATECDNSWKCLRNEKKLLPPMCKTLPSKFCT